MSECTFTPKINNLSKEKRSIKEFIENQRDYKHKLD